MKIYEASSLEALIASHDHWRSVIAETITREAIVFRGLFDADRLLALRRWVFDFRFRHGLAGDMAYNSDTPDHVKLVDKPLISARPTRFVLSQFFMWNAPEYADVRRIAEGLMTFRNLTSGLAAGTGYDDVTEYVSWPCVVHYRKGGDFLAAHRDDYAYQTILLLSELGRDFETGGNYVLTEAGHVFTETDLRFGDLLLLKSDIVHGVHPIDPASEDTEGESGRWMLFCPLAKRESIIRPQRVPVLGRV